MLEDVGRLPQVATCHSEPFPGPEEQWHWRSFAAISPASPVSPAPSSMTPPPPPAAARRRQNAAPSKSPPLPATLATLATLDTLDTLARMPSGHEQMRRNFEPFTCFWFKSQMKKGNPMTSTKKPNSTARIKKDGPSMANLIVEILGACYASLLEHSLQHL